MTDENDKTPNLLVLAFGVFVPDDCEDVTNVRV